MSDDLVKRLRGNHDDISHEDIYESADRIERDAQHIDEMYALVAAMNADHTASKTRIEKLEAALRWIIDCEPVAFREADFHGASCKCRRCAMDNARQLVGGKDD